MGELLDVELPQGEYDTVAGFIMDRLGRIPQEDEHPVVVYQNVTFTVREVLDRRIEKVHVEVTPLPEPGEEDKDSRRAEKKPDGKGEERGLIPFVAPAGGHVRPPAGALWWP